MDLNDKAQDRSGVEVRLAANLHGGYVLADDQLTPADEIGNDDFPKYGDFLTVFRLDRSTGEAAEDEPVLYVECPQHLAQVLVENGAEPGTAFVVENVAKDMNGSWVVDVAFPDQ